MNDSRVIEDRIRSFISVDDDSDWQEVVCRAGVSRHARLGAARSRREPRPMRPRRRRALLALGLVTAIVVPAAAFADDLGTLLGLTNHGTPVAASTLSHDASLAQAMRQLGFPSTLQLLGTRDGIRFYAAQKRHGYCLAVVASAAPAVSQRPASDAGCENGSDGFPSARNPVSVFPVSGRFAGFAADGVASVALIDASGATLATAKVSDNLFIGGAMPTGPYAIVALDARGDTLASVQTRPVTSAAGPKTGG
jgi:hypothetical protein